MISPPKRQAHPPTSQTRRHEGTKKSQSHPATLQRRGAETQSHRGALTGFFCVARSWPPNGGIHRLTSAGETPWSPFGGHGTTGSGNRVESELSCRFPDPAACALEERRSRLFSSSFNSWEGHASSPHKKEKRQNRRANGTSAGEKTNSDECLHPERKVFSPATGDHRSPVVLPPISGVTIQAQHPPLCVSGWVVGLRVFVPSCLRRGWVGGSVSSVPLWFFRRLGNANPL